MLPLHDENPTERVAWVALALIVANVVVFMWIQPRGLGAQDLSFVYDYAAIPCEVTGECEPVEGKNVALSLLFTMFLHGSWLHLGFNMWFLWVFGNNIEDHLDRLRFLLFYLAAGLVGTVAHITLDVASQVPLIGASGAVAGVMGAYLVWFPNARVRTLLFFGLVLFVRPKAKWLLLVWFGSQFLIDPNDGIAWMAHVGGFLTGALVGLLVRESRRARQALWTPRYADDESGLWDNRFGGRGDNPLPPYQPPPELR